eukprot:4449787-Prymnesium_polylepis.1
MQCITRRPPVPVARVAAAQPAARDATSGPASHTVNPTDGVLASGEGGSGSAGPGVAAAAAGSGGGPVSYTHLRAHETLMNL